MVLFPLMLKLAGRKCVVVGAGRVARAKTKGLLDCGAQVTVVSPKAERQIRAAAETGQLVWRRKLFSRRDLTGAFLVIAATDSPTINSTVFRSCQARNILCNSVDDPEHFDFYYPAVVRRGPLLISVSTTGNSPALAARLRRQLARQFGPEWATLVEQVSKRRQEILKAKPGTRRKHLLDRYVVNLPLK